MKRAQLKLGIFLSRREELNPQPTAYKAVALPLSYSGLFTLCLYSSTHESIVFNRRLSE